MERIQVANVAEEDIPDRDNFIFGRNPENLV